MSKKNKNKDQNKEIKKEPLAQPFSKEPSSNTWNKDSRGDQRHSGFQK